MKAFFITKVVFLSLAAAATAQDISDRRVRENLPASGLSTAADFQTPTMQVDKFVRDIALCGRQARTTRWLALPKLEVTSNSSSLKAFAESSFASISQATKLTTPGDGMLHVFIGTSRDFNSLEVVKRLGVRMVGTSGCMFWQNKDQSLKEALVFIKDAPEKAEEFQQHALFHNLLAGFGFMKNSTLFPDSTFGTNNAFALQLSPLDTLLIAFCYQHVPPASLSSDVSKLLKLHWNK